MQQQLHVQVYVIQNKRPVGHIAHLNDNSQLNFQKFLKFTVYVQIYIHYVPFYFLRKLIVIQSEIDKTKIYAFQ